MKAGTRFAAIVFALLLPCLLSASAGAGDADARAASFDKALERIHEQLKKERFKSGLQALERLLKSHAKADHAYARRADLVDLAERLAFGSKYGAPSAAGVVSGRLLKWDKQKGYIQIIYTPNTCGDLKKKGGLLVFPARINGPFLLQVYGKEYAYTTKQAPQVSFGGDLDPDTKKPQSWHLVFGVPPYIDGDYKVWLPASIVHMDGNRKDKTPATGKCAAKRGKPFKLQLKVTTTGIGAGVNGTTWCKVRKPRGVWGNVGFSAVEWTKMAFTGMIEPAWIQSRLDKVVQKQRRDFKRAYKPTQVLPAWLFEKGPKPVAPKRTPIATQREYPVRPGAKHKRTLFHYKTHGKAGRWRSALKSVEKLRQEGAPGVTCDFLAARAHYQLGRVKEGLAEVDRVLTAEPDYLPALLLRGRLHRRGGAPEAALEAFRAATAKYAGNPQVYETAVMAMLAAGRPDAADKLLLQARRAGAVSSDLETLSKVLVKARHGPTWNQTFEYKSRNYHVLSDIDKPTCKLACDLLEEAHTSYRVNLHWTSRDKTQRFKVFLFNGQAGFVEYTKDMKGYAGVPDPRVLGVYSGILKQLLIWHLPDRARMLETIRHEGFHQYLDRFMPDPPIWFNEGLAVYHQNARKTLNGLQFGQIHTDYLEVMKKAGLQKMDAFLEQAHGEFYARGGPAYGQAWAFVHMLRRGKAEYRALFKEMVKALETEPGGEVVERLFPKAKRRQLEAEFRAYVAALE